MKYTWLGYQMVIIKSMSMSNVLTGNLPIHMFFKFNTPWKNDQKGKTERHVGRRNIKEDQVAF